MLLGKPNCGKTALINRLITENYITKHNEIHGDSYHKKIIIDDKEIYIDIKRSMHR